MSGILAICHRHGVVSVEGLGIVSGGGQITFSGSSTTRCPVCGARAEIIDGSYKYDLANKPTVTLTPSPAQLLRLQTAAHWAQKALTQPEVDPDLVEKKLRRAVEKEAPGLSSMLDKALGTKSATVAGWVAALLAVLALVAGGQQSQISEEDVARIIEQVRQYDAAHDVGTMPDRQAPRPQQAPQAPEVPTRMTGK